MSHEQVQSIRIQATAVKLKVCTSDNLVNQILQDLRSDNDFGGGFQVMAHFQLVYSSRHSGCSLGCMFRVVQVGLSILKLK